LLRNPTSPRKRGEVKLALHTGTKAQTRINAAGIGAEFIRGLERVTIGPAKPELTFILDVPAKVGLARAKARRGQDGADRFEAESIAYHEELRKAYLGLADKEPKRCVVIDGRAPREIVAERIWNTIRKNLKSEEPKVAESAHP